MQNKGFETHITLNLPLERELEAEKIAKDWKWKTSSIKDDPILGPGLKFYFTRHDVTYDDAYYRMQQMHVILDTKDFKVIRKKIEEIVFDEVIV